MKVSIVGIGLGNPDTLTRRAEAVIRESQCLIGAQRMLDAFPDHPGERLAAVKPQEIADCLCACGKDSAAVLMSGDVGFYSGARGLCALLERYEHRDFQVECVPGISSVQYFCARLRTSWDDARLLSLHGREQDLLGAVLTSPKVFLLTGGGNSPQAVCARLTERGLGWVTVWVGERLSYPDERVATGTAQELAGREFDPLSVMLVCNPKAHLPPAAHGLPDEAFLRGDAPMTKSEVRTVSISALNLRRGDVVWDVGAGTGSVCVEIARLLPENRVYAIEKEPDAVELLRENRMRFGCWNLEIVEGRAPAALAGLPAPDAVFVGGSGGAMPQTIGMILEKNPKVRIVANAITLETVGAVLDCFNRNALPRQNVVQMTVARSKTVGGNHMMMGQNPIYILSAGGEP